jgi:8-oxo-dGTP pyrophosphatase MutT (NUDIX family)
MELSTTKLSTTSTELSSTELSNNTKRKPVSCVNCGQRGHVVKECKGPITSYGIIAFKIINSSYQEKYDKNEYLTNITKGIISDYSYPKIKFLMIQRKDTMGYIDLVRGKYNEYNKDMLIKTYIDEMTSEEKHNLLYNSFEDIWYNLWCNHNSKLYKNEFYAAKEKFNLLNIKELISKSNTNYSFQEFSFPKGRRNMQELSRDCAEREFYEETRYTNYSYEFIKNYPTITEEFIGTNGIKYKHIYYLVKMKDNIPKPNVDKNNLLQIGEVRNIGWFSYSECISLIRPYDTEKKNIIKQVYFDILKMNGEYPTTTRLYIKKPNRIHLIKSKSI